VSVSAVGVEDLDLELARERIGAAIALLAGAAPERLLAQTAEVLEEAAAALACASALLAPRGSSLAAHLEEQVTGLLRAAASFELVADGCRRGARAGRSRPRKDRRGDP
jgi:hypothetical protein